jgi:hypothetical protein
MRSDQINVLVSTFPGLGLPPTISFAVCGLASVSDISDQLARRLPNTSTRWLLSRTSGTQLEPSSTALVRSLLTEHGDSILSLRLAVPLLGGKGGFGSQLRAAGGRMSSKRKKNDGDANGSSRNLDGRRLRTVNEAKALAELLQIKPEMERKEKEKRRQRWEQIVEATEQREQRIRHGGDGDLDGKWVEAKEEAEERTRDAVAAAMKKGSYSDNLLSTSAGSKSSQSNGSASDEEDDEEEGQGPAKTQHAAKSWKGKGKAMAFAGFDEEDADDSMSSSDDDEVQKRE